MALPDDDVSRNAGELLTYFLGKYLINIFCSLTLTLTLTDSGMGGYFYDDVSRNPREQFLLLTYFFRGYLINIFW